MNQETKVGLFLIAASAAVLGAILFLGNVRLFERTDQFHVDFRDIEALPPKATVKIAGVEVGRVSRIRLVDGQARITISVSPDISLYANATARIGSTGVIGTRFVDLNPGGPPAPQLKEGAVITGLDSGSMNEMFAKIGSLFDDDPEHGNAVDNLKATIANIRSISAALETALGQRERDLLAIVENIRELTASGRVFAKNLEEISEDRKEDVQVALQRFRDIGEKLNGLLARIERGEGTIGALVVDEETGQKVKDAISSIQETASSAQQVLGRFTKIETYWDYRLRYDFRDEDARSDLGIELRPRPEKFYAVGVTNIGDMPSNEKFTKFERRNRITAVMGHDWGPFTGYAGAIRSDGGLGLKFRPLWFDERWKRRLELQAEVSDFSRDRVVLGRHLDSPWLATGAQVALTRWWRVGVRVEDVLERSAFMGYTNIVFRDEDLAYLLGFVSVAR